MHLVAARLCRLARHLWPGFMNNSAALCSQVDQCTADRAVICAAAAVDGCGDKNKQDMGRK